MRSRDSVTGKKQASRRRGAAIAALALAVILIGTLWPMTPRAEAGPFFCLLCGERGLADYILNVALFVPLGVGLVLAGVRPATAVVVGLATTIGVEALQVNVVPGRDPSLGDILANTLGTWLGVIGAHHAAAVFFPGRGRAAFGAALSGGAATGVLAATAWLLGLRLPEATWYGQWAPELGQYERFQGTVESASLNTAPLPPGRVRDTPQRLARVRADGLVELDIAFTPAGPTSDLAPIVSVFDEHRRKVLLLGQNGRRFQFEARTRAEAYGFRTPAATVNAPGWRDTVPARALGLADQRGMHLTVQQGNRRWTARTPHSAAVGWLLLSPFSTPGNATLLGVFGALWVGALWIPWGYYWRRARAVAGAEPGEWAGIVAPVVAFGLASIIGWGTVGPLEALAAGPLGAFLGSRAADRFGGYAPSR